jgi:hypothetical protein
MTDLWLVLYSFGSSEALAPGGNMLLNRGALNPGQGRGPATTNHTRLHFLRYPEAAFAPLGMAWRSALPLASMPMRR